MREDDASGPEREPSGDDDSGSDPLEPEQPPVAGDEPAAGHPVSSDASDDAQSATPNGGAPGTMLGEDGQDGDDHRTGPETTDDGPGWKLYVFDLVSSVGIVVVIGLLLFAASGIWPPMVAVESGSMEPVLERGDLVYVMESDRFPGAGAQGDTGVVTQAMGERTGYQKFDGYGDVIVFEPNGNNKSTPVIHRAMLYVEEGENWVEDANPAYLRGEDSCSDFDNSICPAPYDGFITKGDDNAGYDQVTGISSPVKSEWVIGTAEMYVPYLGQIRLGSALPVETAVRPVP